MKEQAPGLLRNALVGMLKLVVIMGLLLFVPAWTLRYWQAWVFILVFTLCTLVITFYLWKNDPALLRRRIKAGPGAEKRTKQKIVQALAAVAFMALMAFPAVDYRLGWSQVSTYSNVVGLILVALGFLLVFLVFKTNSYTAATIEVEKKQRVISTGPYALVRHPMYAGAFVLLTGIPIALGSWWALLMLLPIMGATVWRLLDEEKYLAQNLQGYTTYCKKVQYRLVPFIW